MKTEPSNRNGGLPRFHMPSLPGRRQKTTQDRRAGTRFQISTPVNYDLGDHEGTGTTRDLSASGVFIQTDEPLSVGKFVRISIKWPCRLGGLYTVSIAIDGKVVRATPEGVAIAILKYEYQTQLAEQTAPRNASAFSA